MPNTILTSDVITSETLLDLHNELTLAMTANRRWDKEFDKSEYTVGSTVNVRLPVQYIAGDGRVATSQSTIEKSIPFNIQHQPHVMIEFNSEDLTLSIDKFKERYTRQVARTLANQIDITIASYLTDFYHWFGTPGTVMSTYGRVNDMRAFMSKLGIPSDDRYLGLSFDDSAGLGNTFMNGTIFTPQFNDEIKKNAMLGTMAQFDIYQGSHFSKHISGTGGGTAPVNGLIASGTVQANVASGNAIVITGLPVSTTGTFLKGDVITIGDVATAPGVYVTNLKDHQATNIRPQFVVTADAPVTSSGGVVTIQVSPEIITDPTNPYQNISLLIPAGAIVQLAQTHTVNVAYNKEAIAIVSPKMIVPAGSAKSTFIRDDETGLGLRMSEFYDIDNDINKMRFDLLLGVKMFPELGIRSVA